MYTFLQYTIVVCQVGLKSMNIKNHNDVYSLQNYVNFSTFNTFLQNLAMRGYKPQF